ncbi:MAG: filamentous hemagglutinin N-terminal domain-containing protein [Candidatus Omnitrophica bacterium]|nr:filamentous hemagglutinin N-terminal domain-containing protein [Candidatus Omnitrophota bacterium]
MKTLTRILLFAAFIMLSATSVFADGTNMTVVSGDVQVSTDSATNTTTYTVANNSIAEFTTFNVPQNTTVNVVSQADSASALFRVTGSEATTISGNFNSYIQFLMLVNSNGINVTSTANINANNLVMSTLDVSNTNFINGNYALLRDQGADYARILNEGTIRGTNIALIASAVENRGIIVATAGTIHLASGDKTVVTFDAKGFINVEVTEATSGSVVNADGSTVKDAIANSGTLEAHQVFLTAKTAQGIFENAVNNTGIIRATRLVSENGKIKIVAEGSNVTIAGTLTSEGDIEIDSDMSVNVTAAMTADNIYIGSDSSPTLISLTGETLENITALSPNVEIYKTGPTLYIETLTINDTLITIEGTGLNVSYLTTSNVTLKSDGLIDTSSAVILTAPTLTLIANQFGTYDKPLKIDADTLNIRKTTGDFDILESTGIGTSILLRGPPEGGFGSILYNKDAILNLIANSINLIGADPINLYGDITFSNLTCIVPGKVITFESGHTYTITGTLTIEGTSDAYITLQSSVPGEGNEFTIYINAVSDAQGNAYLAYVKVYDSIATGPATPIQVKSGTVIKTNASGWDADRYWVGSGDWSDAANHWSDSSGGATSADFLPTSDDMVIFDGNSGSCIIDGSISIYGVTIASNYLSTITRSDIADNITIDVSSGGWAQSGGTFTADSASGTSTITVSGNMTINGGATFNAGSQTLTVGGLAVRGTDGETGGMGGTGSVGDTGGTGGRGGNGEAYTGQGGADGIAGANGNKGATGSTGSTGTTGLDAIFNGGIGDIIINGDLDIVGGVGGDGGTGGDGGSPGVGGDGGGGGDGGTGSTTGDPIGPGGSGGKGGDGGNGGTGGDGGVGGTGGDGGVATFTCGGGDITVEGNITVSDGSGGNTGGAGNPGTGVGGDGATGGDGGAGGGDWGGPGGIGGIGGTGSTEVGAGGNGGTAGTGGSSSFTATSTTINAKSCFSSSGAFTNISGTVIIGGGAGFNYINMSATSSFNNLTLLADATCYTDIIINGTLTVPANLKFSTIYTVTGNGGSNALLVSGTITVGKTTFTGAYSGFETITLNPGSTVSYVTDADAIIDSSFTYYNLKIGEYILLSGRVYTLDGNTTVTNLCTINSLTLNVATLSLDGHTLILSGSGTPLIVGSRGRIDTTTGTISYQGSSATNVAATNYYNLDVNHTATTFTLAGAANVYGDFSVSAGTFDPNGSTLTGSGTSALDVTGTLKVDAATFAGNYIGFASPTLNAGSTVEYSGATAQAIDNTLTYVNLALSGVDTKTLAGDTTITGDLTIGSGSTLASGNYDITLSGSWYNNSGTFTYGTGEVEFVGTGDANITGDNTFYDFTCEVAGKSLIFEADKLQDIKGILTLKGTSTSKLIFKSSTTGTTNTQWKINPEGAVVTQYLDGYDSNNLGATIYDPTSLFTRCTNWMGTARPVPAPSGNTNTPQINNAIFFFNPTSSMMITSAMGGGMMMGPGGVMLSAPAYSNISIPTANMQLVQSQMAQSAKLLEKSGSGSYKLSIFSTPVEMPELKPKNVHEPASRDPEPSRQDGFENATVKVSLDSENAAKILLPGNNPLPLRAVGLPSGAEKPADKKSINNKK